MANHFNIIGSYQYPAAGQPQYPADRQIDFIRIANTNRTDALIALVFKRNQLSRGELIAAIPNDKIISEEGLPFARLSIEEQNERIHNSDFLQGPFKIHPHIPNDLLFYQTVPVQQIVSEQKHP